MVSFTTCQRTKMNWEKLLLVRDNHTTAKPLEKPWKPKRRWKRLRAALAPSVARGRALAWDALPSTVKLGAVACQAVAAVWAYCRRVD